MVSAFLSLPPLPGRSGPAGDQLWPPLLGSVRAWAQVVSFSLGLPLCLEEEEPRSSPWGPQGSGQVWFGTLLFLSVKEKYDSGTS